MKMAAGILCARERNLARLDIRREPETLQLCLALVEPAGFALLPHQSLYDMMPRLIVLRPGSPKLWKEVCLDCLDCLMRNRSEGESRVDYEADSARVSTRGSAGVLELASSGAAVRRCTATKSRDSQTLIH